MIFVVAFGLVLILLPLWSIAGSLTNIVKFLNSYATVETMGSPDGSVVVDVPEAGDG